MGRTSRRFVRSRNLVAYWKKGEFVLEEFVRRRQVTVAPSVIPLLAAFERPRSILSVAKEFPQYELRSFKRSIRSLAKLGFLLECDSAPSPPNVLDAWEESFPAIYYQFASRDVRYLTDPVDKLHYVQERLAEAPQPASHKSYPRKTEIPLEVDPSDPEDSIARILRQRRTVREFAGSRISFSDFSAVIRGTWGQTAWLDAGPLGRLVAKTSPSAGARHPIECYVLAWKVDGLAAGLYHYSVRKDRLEQLQRGDFRAEAVRIASGQRWIGRAAFLCVMTAVTDRVFWKYRLPDAYRLFFLDAGHLGQTFALLATARGLGPFTTAAIQEKHIERLCGIDGIREFPVYLCGAGAPGPRRTTFSTASDPIPSSSPR